MVKVAQWELFTLTVTRFIRGTIKAMVLSDPGHVSLVYAVNEAVTVHLVSVQTGKSIDAYSLPTAPLLQVVPVTQESGVLLIDSLWNVRASKCG